MSLDDSIQGEAAADATFALLHAVAATVKRLEEIPGQPFEADLFQSMLRAEIQVHLPGTASRRFLEMFVDILGQMIQPQKP